MVKTKRKKAEEAGWHFGSAEEFLGLSEIQSIIVALRLALHQALKAQKLAISRQRLWQRALKGGKRRKKGASTP